MYFIIGADLVPTQSNQDMFSSGDAVSLVGQELFDYLNNAEHRIFNIEAPITDFDDPIRKCGPNLQIPSSCMCGFSLLRIDIVTIANNHILDQGEKGLFDTCKYLDEAGIRYTGAGADINEARKPVVFRFNDRKIGIYACAEHEFSIATKDSAGANPFDPLESPDDVYNLKQICDYIIVLYHGGKELYRYPSPALQKICRKLIEKGADLVVCQHSHCVGCEEKYKGGTIVYGQGNFIFDRRNNEYWNSGLLIQIDDRFQVEYVPIVKKESMIRIASENEKIEIMDSFTDRSKQICAPEFIQKNYSEFAKKSIMNYLQICYPVKKDLFFRIMNRLTKGQYYNNLINKRYDSTKAMKLLNCIDCEAHKELFTQGLLEMLNKEEESKLYL